MWLTFEEYKKGPIAQTWEEWEQTFYYIIDTSHYGNYEDISILVLKMLKEDPRESTQLACAQALEMSIPRFCKIKKEILEILLNNLLSNSKTLQEIAAEALYNIAQFICITKVRKIYLTFFKQDIDFYIRGRLFIYTQKQDISRFNTDEERRNYVLSLCHYCPSYEEASSVCYEHLANEENSEDFNISIIQGLTYLLMRFKKIEFKKFRSLIKRLIPVRGKFYNSKGPEYIYIEPLLANIALMLPEYKKQAITMLKRGGSRYCRRYKIC